MVKACRSKSQKWSHPISETRADTHETDLGLPNNTTKHRQPRFTATHLAFFSLLAITFGSIAWLVFQASKAPEQLSGFASPFSTLPGNESHPTFSPDGKWLAFVHFNNQSLESQLLIKPMGESGAFLEFDANNQAQARVIPSQRLLPEIVVTKGVRFIRSPSWAPHSKQLAFMQHDLGQCQIRIVSFDRLMNVTDNQLIRNCSEDGHSQVSWGNNADQLYFTDRDIDSPYQVWRHDIAQKTSQSITALKDTTGFHLIRVSPSKAEAIAIKDINRKRSEFYLLNLISGSTEKLMAQKGVYYDIDWNADGSAFYFNHSQ